MGWGEERVASSCFGAAMVSMSACLPACPPCATAAHIHLTHLLQAPPPARRWRRAQSGRASWPTASCRACRRVLESVPDLSMWWLWWWCCMHGAELPCPLVHSSYSVL